MKVQKAYSCDNGENVRKNAKLRAISQFSEEVKGDQGRFDIMKSKSTPGAYRNLIMRKSDIRQSLSYRLKNKSSEVDREVQQINREEERKHIIAIDEANSSSSDDSSESYNESSSESIEVFLSDTDEEEEDHNQQFAYAGANRQQHTGIFDTNNEAVIAESDGEDDEEMDDDIDEMPINTLPQNRQTGPGQDPDPEVINNNNDQQIKVTRGLKFARKLKFVENMQRRR